MKLDRKFYERVATYLVGVAIGLVLLGVIQMQRAKARAAHQQQQQSAPQPAPADRPAADTGVREGGP